MVIQRIQSVYLLIASILMGCYSFSDVILVKTINETLEKVSLFDASLISFIISILVTVLSLVSIFKYKALKLQIGLCFINVLLTLTQIAVLVIESLNLSAFKFDQFLMPNCMPIISIILLILSILAIKRDKKLLSSYDRLR